MKKADFIQSIRRAEADVQASDKSDGAQKQTCQEARQNWVIAIRDMAKGLSQKATQDHQKAPQDQGNKAPPKNQDDVDLPKTQDASKPSNGERGKCSGCTLQ